MGFCYFDSFALARCEIRSFSPSRLMSVWMFLLLIRSFLCPSLSLCLSLYLFLLSKEFFVWYLTKLNANTVITHIITLNAINNIFWTYTKFNSLHLELTRRKRAHTGRQRKSHSHIRMHAHDQKISVCKYMVNRHVGLCFYTLFFHFMPSTLAHMR